MQLHDRARSSLAKFCKQMLRMVTSNERVFSICRSPVGFSMTLSAPPPATALFPHFAAQSSRVGLRDRAVQPPKAIAMGDSLVYGYGDPEGGGWVERLRRQWMNPEAPGPILYNLGVRGDGVLQVLDRWEAEFRCRGELRNRQPDGLLLGVGVNDSARLGKPDGKNFTDFERYREALTELLERSRQCCPVWMVGMVPVTEAAMPFLECFYYCHAEQYRYKEAAKQMCHERQIPYLDLFDRWLARGTSWRQARMCADGLHPNATGYESIVRDISMWLGELSNT